VVPAALRTTTGKEWASAAEASPTESSMVIEAAKEEEAPLLPSPGTLVTGYLRVSTGAPAPEHP
jgi:hypothetical protein